MSVWSSLDDLILSLRWEVEQLDRVLIARPDPVRENDPYRRRLRAAMEERLSQSVQAVTELRKALEAPEWDFSDGRFGG